MVKSFLAGLEVEWKESTRPRKRKISCVAAAVVIGFCEVLIGEEFFLASLKDMLKFWEETRLRNRKFHVGVTLQERLEGETR